MTTLSKPGLRPATPNFSSGPCAKRPGWSLQALDNAALGRSHRAKIGKTKAGDRHRAHPRGAAGSRRLPHRHRAGVRHRRRRDGDVVAAGRARRRHADLGIVRRRLGHRRGQAAQAQGRARLRRALRRAARSCRRRFRPRRRLHLERHDVRRSRRECRFHSRRIARGSPSATRPRRPSPSASTSPSSMSSPSPGRRCWVARARTACSSCRRARSHGSRATSPNGRCRRSSG